uniref:amidase n=1 Tax=Bionectria ochroleuca TaxID=29856 RepID=A0A8H7KCZ8_BIOOC
MNQWPSETPLNLCLEVIKPLWYPFYLIFEYLLHPVWSYLYPLSAYHEERREQTRLKAAAQRLDDEFKQLQVKNHRSIPATNAPAYPSGPIFTKVPLDVRRQILIEAFGAQTVHLDLDVVEKTKGQRKVISWQWMNWVEIRSHALEDRTNPLTQGDVLGIVRLVLQAGYYRVDKPTKKASRFYTGRTQFISSHSPFFASKFLIFDEIFAGLSPKGCPNLFRFPFLARLHIICALKYSLVNLIDRLARRIASSRTQVNVFCASWEVYTAVDLKLAENHGFNKTILHWADLGGLRCWREMTPKEEVDSDASPRGYWIHLSSQLMPSYHGAAKKRQGLRDSIPKSHLLPAELAKKAAKGLLLPLDPEVLKCGVLNDLGIEITSIDDAAVLLDRIAKRIYSAVAVTEAFCKRASIAQQTVNCLTEILYDKAIERAKYLDDYLENHGTTSGILHGLPDLFGVKCAHATAGLASWIPNVSVEDSPITKGIIAAGGVLYVKTNVSQGHLMVESINNVFGTTSNPYNTALSAGGSSGGESALIAAKGSILGSATDGGGSIRMPAAFCGLWGVKCSKGRMPTMGIQSPGDGNESTNAGLGPMARSVSGCELWLQAQLQNQPWNFDFNCIPMPWNKEKAQRPKSKLVIGVVRDDGVIRPTPPVSRAWKRVITLLALAGQAIIDVPAGEIKEIHQRGTSCAMKSNVQGGGYGIMQHIIASGEPVVPRTATGSSASLLTTHEIFANYKERADLAARYNALWVQYSLDAILAPAVAPGTTTWQVDLERDVAPPEWYNAPAYPRIEEVRFPYDWGDKEMKEIFSSPEVFKDSPVGVQIACRRLQEEKCVGILKEIEALLKEGRA